MSERIGIKREFIHSCRNICCIKPLCVTHHRCFHRRAVHAGEEGQRTLRQKSGYQLRIQLKVTVFEQQQCGILELNKGQLNEVRCSFRSASSGKVSSSSSVYIKVYSWLKWMEADTMMNDEQNE